MDQKQPREADCRGGVLRSGGCVKEMDASGPVVHHLRSSEGGSRRERDPELPPVLLCQGQVLLEKQGKDKRNGTAAPGAKKNGQTRHTLAPSAKCWLDKWPIRGLGLRCGEG